MAAAVDITAILQSTQSLNAEQRGSAEQQLKQFEEHQLAVYLVSLASEVGNNAKPPEARQIAGVVLKNALSAPNAERRVGFDWLLCSPLFRVIPSSRLTYTFD